ncbi:DUF6585 family protein [Streptomyces bacillaris]|uniref:DUF6585 family protein n=1 Tax=Streptomyces bacillaris TaxID=68179 RepID=UPI0036475F3B
MTSQGTPEQGGGFASDGLGSPVAAFDGSKSGASRNTLLGAGAGALVTVPPLAVGLMGSVPPLILLGGIGAALTALFTVRSLLRLRSEGAHRVGLHERGLIHHVGDRAEQVLWTDVHELTVFGQTIVLNGAAVGGVSGCYLQRSDGHKVILTSHHLAGVERLVPQVVTAVTEAQFPPALDRIRGGGQVAFRDVHMDEEGLVSSGRRLVWSHLGSVDVEQGKVTVRDGAGGRWLRKDVILFPNLPLFLTLVGLHTPR